MQRRFLTLACLVIALLSPLVPPAVAGSQPAITMLLSPRVLTYGGSRSASASILSAGPCAPGRTVDLQQKPPGAATWTTLDTETSAATGDVSFPAWKPQGDSRYRAVAEPGVAGSTTCDQLVSSVVRGVVRAAVTLRLGHASIAAGSCTAAHLLVRPNKSGQQVVLQGRRGSKWTTVRTLSLDAESKAAAALCETWSDLGTRAYRASWSPQQDPTNDAGTSGPVSLTVVRADWMRRIDRLTNGRAIGVSIRADGRVLYEREATTPFAPASNEKLLLSMALLDRLGTAHRIDTVAAAGSVNHGVVRGDLWIMGHGDPSTGPGQLKALAGAVARAGVTRITGRVMGSTGYFSHDWYAPGWRKFFPKIEVGLPSALTFKENHVNGKNVADPERFAAAALLRRLRGHGVDVGGAFGSGHPPDGLDSVAEVSSIPLRGLLHHMDHVSDNFYAEVLGKGLAAIEHGPPGTIARAAAVIQSWGRAHGASVALHDSSGLSYRDRATPHGLTTLLQFAEGTPWGDALRGALPAAGQGTLKDRHLGGVKLHAKTGTLNNISALSGWVWLSSLKTWGEFSILDRRMGYTTAKDTEDAIVRTVAASAH